MGSMLVGAFYLNSEPGSSTKDRNYYFDANGKLQEWNYPLNTSKQTNKALSRNIRFDKNHVANNHQGSDIISSLKEPVRNIVAGKVEYASKYGSTGNTVIVSATELSPTLYIRYFHVDSLAGGIEGKSIPRNELIGYMLEIRAQIVMALICILTSVLKKHSTQMALLVYCLMTH